MLFRVGRAGASSGATIDHPAALEARADGAVVFLVSAQDALRLGRPKPPGGTALCLRRTQRESAPRELAVLSRMACKRHRSNLFSRLLENQHFPNFAALS